MKVFISWSGEVSHAVALGLKDWLPNVIQALEPFVSSEDIAKGGRWLAKINAELEGAEFGIICLTPQNLASPWVLFEAGALSIRFPEGRVAPLLIGLSSVDVTPPLSQFQATEVVRDQMLKLVHDINERIKDKPLPEHRLMRAFDDHWSDIDKILHEQAAKAKAAPAALPAKRDLESMVAEMLQIVRSLQRDPVEAISNQLAARAVQDVLRRRAREMSFGEIFGTPGMLGSPKVLISSEQAAAAVPTKKPETDDS